MSGAPAEVPTSNDDTAPGRGWSVLLGSLLALLILTLVVRGRTTRFEDLALGRATTSVFATHDGRKVHASDVEGMREVVEGAQARGLGRQVILLGNSQLHAINQYQQGDETAPAILFASQQERDADVVTFSYPNANLQEHYLAFSYARSRLPALRAVLLGVVFDDLRETGLRSDLRRAFNDTSVRRTFEASETGQRLLAEIGDDASEVIDEDLGGVRDTFQERSEGTLNTWLDAHWSLWRARPQARGQLFAKLYLLRNTAFGIDAQSKRPLRQGSYVANMAALRQMLADARQAKIAVLVYIVPLRNDIEPPYLPSEYESFKAEVAGLVGDGVYLADFEDVVPPELWGMKGSTDLDGSLEVDFMHFQGRGHRLLGAALQKQLETTLSGALK